MKISCLPYIFISHVTWLVHKHKPIPHPSKIAIVSKERENYVLLGIICIIIVSHTDLVRHSLIILSWKEVKTVVEQNIDFHFNY